MKKIAAAVAADRLLTLPEAARLLGMGQGVVRKMVYARELSYVRRGPRGAYRFRLSELNRWIDQNTRRSLA